MIKFLILSGKTPTEKHEDQISVSRICSFYAPEKKTQKTTGIDWLSVVVHSTVADQTRYKNCNDGKAARVKTIIDHD